jgi:L-amino acid N-acyltransferase YncA
MIIRDAAEADLPAIVEIYNEGIRGRVSTAQLEEVSVEQRRNWFHEHSADVYPLWVAEVDGRIAGWLSFHSYINRAGYRATAEISVYVGEQFRRHGAGKALLGKAVVAAPELGVSALIGNIFAQNEASLRLFTRAGFERWGFLPRVARVDGVERDVVIMGRRVEMSKHE